MKQIVFFTLGLVCLTQLAHAEVRGRSVAYQSPDGTLLQGYLAFDEEWTEKKPGVLVVHEWWGHNEYARERARMLAELGYVAFAIDMYGDGKVANHPNEAGAFATVAKKNIETSESRFQAALEYLQNFERTDTEKIAAIGYCFGGGMVLEMLRRGIDLDGVVSFHGSLSTNMPAHPLRVKGSALVCHGEEDHFVSADDIDAFKKEMEKAEVDYEFKSYPGAKHSFTNPDADRIAKEFGLGVAYHPEADKQSWQDMKVFLKRVFEDAEPLENSSEGQ